MSKFGGHRILVDCECGIVSFEPGVWGLEPGSPLRLIRGGRRRRLRAQGWGWNDLRPLLLDDAAGGCLDLEYSALAWSIRLFLCSYSRTFAAALWDDVMEPWW